jgi:hypothetical protein
VEYKDDDFMIIDNTKELTAIRARQATTTTTTTVAPLEKSLRELLQSIEESAEKLSKRLEKLEKREAKPTRGGIFLTWAQLSFLFSWPLVLLGFYHWWRKRSEALALKAVA